MAHVWLSSRGGGGDGDDAEIIIDLDVTTKDILRGIDNCDISVRRAEHVQMSVSVYMIIIIILT